MSPYSPFSTYKERLEFEALEKTLETLEAEKEGIEDRLGKGDLPYEEISKLSDRYTALKQELDSAEMRWLELSELHF